MTCLDCIPERYHNLGGNLLGPMVTLCPKHAAVDALIEAAEANFAWNIAEEQTIGTFQARMELCNYSQWLTRKALGKQSDYQGVPRLLLDLPTGNVELVRCNIDACKALVREVLDTALSLATKEKK